MMSSRRCRFLVGLTLFVLGIYIPANQLLAQPAQGALDRSSFKAPIDSLRPSVRWWWPGGDVQDAELEREMAVMKAAGFSGAEVQAFAVGLPSNAPPNVYTYGTAGWFNHLTAAVQSARSLGLGIDLTVGSSWPLGSSIIQDSNSLKMLTVSSQFVAGPASLHQSVPAPLKPLSYPVASYLLELPEN